MLGAGVPPIVPSAGTAGEGPSLAIVAAVTLLGVAIAVFALWRVSRAEKTTVAARHEPDQPYDRAA